MAMMNDTEDKTRDRRDLVQSREMQSDFDFSRETYYSLVEKGQEGIEEMMAILKASEHPRAAEVLSKLIKDTGDVADKLMDLNRKSETIKQIIKNGNAPMQIGRDGERVGDTNVFIGSTAELQRLIKQTNEIDITPVPEK